MWVYGTVAAVDPKKPPTQIVSTDAIDGVQMGTYVAQNFTTEADGLQFWTSGLLTVQMHQLVVNITHATEDYAFYFDYLIFTPAPVTLDTPTAW